MKHLGNIDLSFILTIFHLYFCVCVEFGQLTNGLQISGQSIIELGFNVLVGHLAV